MTLEVRDLRAGFRTRSGFVPVLHGVNLALPAGSVTGLVGESGCGKSLTALAIMRLLPHDARVVGGQVLLDSQDLLRVGERDMEKVRGARVAMIFQQPRASLNPVFPVGELITDVLRVHRGLADRAAKAEGKALLARVRLPDPAQVMRSYPHQLSGGMCQRVMIALALACGSQVLLADEPTTALDVTVQQQIIELLRDLQRDLALTVLLITHDLGLVAEMCDHVSVMYAGRVVESAPAGELFERPSHPYTRGLLASRIRYGSRALPAGIIGRVPELGSLPRGCPFHPRCTWAGAECTQVDAATERITDEHQVRCHYWRQVRG